MVWFPGERLHAWHQKGRGRGVESLSPSPIQRGEGRKGAADEAAEVLRVSIRTA